MRKRVFALIAGCALAASLALVGCSGSGSTSADGASTATDAETESTASVNPAENLVGTWEVSDMTENGEPVSADEIQAMKDMGLNITLVLAEDGTAGMDVLGDVMEGGAWEMSNATEGAITFNGVTLPITISNGELSLVDSDTNTVWTFTRTSSSTAMPTSMNSAVPATAPSAASSVDVAGTWNLYEITGDPAVSPMEAQTLNNTGMGVVMTLNEDGSGSMNASGEIMDITWEDTADGLFISLEGSPAPATITGDGMISVDVGNGQVMVFQQTSSAGSNSTGIAA